MSVHAATSYSLRLVREVQAARADYAEDVEKRRNSERSFRRYALAVAKLIAYCRRKNMKEAA